MNSYFKSFMTVVCFGWTWADFFIIDNKLFNIKFTAITNFSMMYKIRYCYCGVAVICVMFKLFIYN